MASKSLSEQLKYALGEAKKHFGQGIENTKDVAKKAGTGIADAADKAAFTQEQVDAAHKKVKEIVTKKGEK